MFTFGKFKKYNRFIERFDKRNDPKTLIPFIDALNVPNHRFQNIVFILCSDAASQAELKQHLKDMMFHVYEIHMLSVCPPDYPYPLPQTDRGVYGEMVYHKEYNIALNLIQPGVWRAMMKATGIVENLTRSYSDRQLFDIFDTTFHHLVIPNGG